MDQAIQNRPATKPAEQESSSWGIVGEISKITLDGITAVVAPGFSAATSLFGSATRACYWLAEQNWQTLFGSNLSVGEESPEAKKLTETWEKLREAAPHSDRLGARLGEITSQIEKISPADPAMQGLTKQRDEILLHMAKYLEENGTSIAELKKLHEQLVSAEVKRYQAEGRPTEEIEQRVKALQESREALDKAVGHTIETIEKLEQTIGQFKVDIHGVVAEDTVQYRGVLKHHQMEEDSDVLESGKRIADHCSEHGCKILEHLAEVKAKLKEGDIEGSSKVLNEVQTKVETMVEQASKDLQEHTETRNTSLLNSGVSKEELSIFEATDRLLKATIASFSKAASSVFSNLSNAYNEIFKLQENFNQESIQFLRMSSAAYNGGAGQSILSLGLFDGPYALTALSFLEEHQRLEKLAAKFKFLAPPATIEEREQYRRIS